jgi:rhodanese-related sulfurtransferase
VLPSPARRARGGYNSSMRKDTRTTLLVAIGTFLTLSVVTAVAYSVMKPKAATVSPVQSAQAVQAAEPETFARISIDDLEPLAARGEVTIIDVRTSEAFLASHIEGALHIPVARLEGEVPYLPKDKRVVTYCTCPQEESSGEAAMILQRFGFDTAALLGGYNAWTTRGFPTATGVK